MTYRSRMLLAGAGTLLGSIIFVTTAARASFSLVPEKEMVIEGAHASSSVPQAVTPVSIPTRISIPSLQVDSVVEKVGINTEGRMMVPHDFTKVGWYKYGPPVGAPGTAVLAGHVDSTRAMEDGVFHNLKGIRVGSDIFVTREDGTKVRFVVTAVRSYTHQKTPADILFGTQRVPMLSETSAALANAKLATTTATGDPGVYLNLITCVGQWIGKEKTYDRRLIVFAKLADLPAL